MPERTRSGKHPAVVQYHSELERIRIESTERSARIRERLRKARAKVTSRPPPPDASEPPPSGGEAA